MRLEPATPRHTDAHADIKYLPAKTSHIDSVNLLLYPWDFPGGDGFA
jgi:hypothetical protein